MTPHIEAGINDYADLVLMPGDPLIAKYIAEKFFGIQLLLIQFETVWDVVDFIKAKWCLFKRRVWGSPA